MEPLFLSFKKSKGLIKTFSFFTSIIFFVSACNDSHEDMPDYSLTSEDKEWLGKFFDDLLFVEGGVYTLWGCKPVTEIVFYHYTEEEMQSNFSEDEKKDCFIQDVYDLPLNWEKWEKICSRFPFKKHLLFRSHFDEDGKASFVYFVDILKTAVTLESHYDMFRKAVQFDFHPLQVVLEMPDSKSIFWKKVRSAENSDLLWGLLFGYGKTNSFAFHWKFFDCPEVCKKMIESYPYRYSNSPPRGLVRLSVNNFNLPPFISFEDSEEMIHYYKKEQKKIKKAYLNNNRLKVTLNKLMK